MSSLPKLKPSHLFIYDRFRDDDSGGAAMQDVTREFKIDLKDDGLGKYNISPIRELSKPNLPAGQREATRYATTSESKRSQNSFTKKKSEVEETLKRIQGHKGVIGVIIVNSEGIPIRTTLDNSTTVQYTGLIHQLTIKARSTVRDIDPQNDLTFLRIRSKKHEIMVAPDKEYLLVVIQNPTV
ncbi:dynein light chain roadblock-type 2 [Nematostella vectensis]|uniref:dynein light chain roadblock-type 2 n=1 Tax=Nematostella vectensis TaxID=45351 RepID=UPI001390666D|nr:dynein light chain roadblock-type 2 [Nematostella vectensis]